MKIHDTIILSIKATQEGARRVVLIATRNTAITVRDAMSGLLLRTMEGALDPTVYTILLENNLVYCGTSNHNILVYTFQVIVYTLLTVFPLQFITVNYLRMAS